MKIIIENNNRILIKDNFLKINMNDGNIIQYTGIYYTPIKDNDKPKDNDTPKDNDKPVEIETTFIGIIEGEKYRYNSGIFGIYIKPLYILDIINNEWLKIINYKEPKEKYFLYPHLLVLPEYSYNYCYHLRFLQTCENIDLDKFINITKTFDLFR